MSKLLEVRDLKAQYGLTRVLHGMSFDLEEGGITTILGANGAGKTTTLRSVCGMVKTEGEIYFDGDLISSKATEDIVRYGIAHVPEGRGTFTRLSVEENLKLAAITRRDKAAVTADEEQVYDYFPRLRERYQQQAGTLSGGEQQMLAIGRVLARDVKLLLLDEPYEGLAPVIVQEIEKTLELIRDQGITTIIVEQNAVAALTLADRAVILDTGQVVFDGDAKDVLENEQLRHDYLAI